MKNISALICLFAASIFSLCASAAPVQYQLTAVAPQNTWSGFIYGPEDTLTATFLYDASVLPDQQLDIPGESRSQYTGVVTDFHAQINGYALDAADFSLTIVDDVDNGNGRQRYMSVMFNGVTPHTVIDGNIYTVQLFSISHAAIGAFSSSLPTNLSIDEPGLTPNELFVIVDSPDPQIGYVYATTFNITSITAVPLPGSLLLFASGLAGLMAKKRKLFIRI